MNLKKPKFWDYKKPNIYAYLLWPIAFLLKLISLVKIKSKIKVSKIKTICVGNIYVGGTGKTSLCIKINEVLNQKKIKSCFIKKFYKNQIDEQKLLKNKGKLFLYSKRMEAINQAEKEGYEIAILDDGLQDHSINYDISLVCFNNINWIGNGFTIPAGPLRENIDSLKKYYHIFLNGNLENLENLKNQIIKINPKIKIHIGKYKPTNINEFDKTDKYLLFSGIGNHNTFVAMVRNYGLNVTKDIEFPDHYNYTDNDIDQILNHAITLNCKIITTEKDYLRLGNNKKDKIKFIKSELEIIDEDKLINTILY
ncbi:tetraacyldisaccharide 4'-kinase [Candidatus Pelagibacter sp.]|nr:tetraacyldisaccharide 4'-kinase [Candidatus Pelagibacter sp.]